MGLSLPPPKHPPINTYGYSMVQILTTRSAKGRKKKSIVSTYFPIVSSSSLVLWESSACSIVSYMYKGRSITTYANINYVLDISVHRIRKRMVAKCCLWWFFSIRFDKWRCRRNVVVLRTRVIYIFVINWSARLWAYWWGSACLRFVVGTYGFGAPRRSERIIAIIIVLLLSIVFDRSSQYRYNCWSFVFLQNR